LVTVRRARSARVSERDAELLETIRALKAEHPFWGYRHVWAELKFAQGLTINKKRVQRIMRENGLAVKSNDKLRASRMPQRSKPRPDRPNQWWGIDMTKVMVEGFGWVYIVLVLDWYSKKVVGHYAGVQCKSEHWLAALEMAAARQFPEQGIRGQGVHLMSDNGCQPTSTRFMEACGRLGVEQAFTSYNNPKGNADTERMMRTLKEEFLWLSEWRSPSELADRLSGWILTFNSSYLHSSLGYRTPNLAEQDYFNKTSPSTLLNAA
jgi:putative transposase